MPVKQEERILRALGAVKDSYVLESAQYVGNPQKAVRIPPKKKKWPAFAAMAAAAAVVVTGAVSLNLLRNRAVRSDFLPLSNTLQISNMTVRRVTFVTSQTRNPRPIEQVQVSLGDSVVQTIDVSNLPEFVQGSNEGMFLSLVPIDELPSDIPGCNQGLFYQDEQGRLVRSDVDFRDVNFDGYNDLGLAAVGGYPENLPYHYLLWNPGTERFEYGFTLCGGAALEVDESRKMLVETVTENGSRSQRYYRYESGGLKYEPVQFDPVSQASDWPAFRMEYDHSKLELVEGVGGIFLYPIEYSDSLPVSELKIEFLPGLLPYTAMEQTRTEMGGDLTAIQQDPETGRYSFRIDQGTDWNSVVKEVTILSAGSRGSFRLTNQYFVEATEGWGTTFAQIVDGFTCPLSESANAEAEKTIMDFADGYFSGNQIAMLANYYGDSKNLSDVYTQDASRVWIGSLEGLNTLDEQIEKDGFAHVSLAFLETENADSFTYLSMEVMKTQAGYRVSSYGLEK